MGRDEMGRHRTGRAEKGRKGTERGGIGPDGTRRDGMGRGGIGRDGTGRDGQRALVRALPTRTINYPETSTTTRTACVGATGNLSRVWHIVHRRNVLLEA